MATGYPWGILDTRTGKVTWFRTERRMRRVLAAWRKDEPGAHLLPVYN